MTKLKHDIFLRLVKMLDACLVTLPFLGCWYWYYASRTASPYYAKGNLLIVTLFFILYIVIGRIYEGFWISTQRISEIVYGQALAAVVCNAVMYLVIWLLSKKLPNPLPLLASFAVQVLFATAWAYAAHRWYFRTFPPQPTAIVYGERCGILKLISEYGLEKKYDVRLTTSVTECLENLDRLAGMETVFLSGIHSHDRNIILKYCVAHSINVFVIPRIGDVIMSGARPRHMFHLPILQVGCHMAQPEYLLIKRAIDIVLSLVAIVLTSPIMLVTAIAIKITEGGPVLYKQLRLSKDAKPFNILKFRSMCVDAEKDGRARLSTGDKDDRVTSVGRVIRKCRIDELPQLFNIIGGTLSICGPRPERPAIHKEYCREIPEFALRLQVKAGLTGYAQVYGKYNTTPYDKLQMDLMYIAHPSIIEDLKIMLATVKILFVPDSTEGVEEEIVNMKNNKVENYVDLTR